MDFIKKSFYVFKNTYLGLAIDFASSILIVRYLGSEDYGHYTVLYILPILIASLGSFGFGPSIVYHVNKIEFNISRYLVSFTFLGLALGLIYIFIIIIFLTYINELLYSNKLNIDLFLISILFIPIMITQKYLRAIIRGMYNIKLFSLLLDLIAPLLRLCLVFVFIYANLGLEGIVCITIIVQSIILLCFFLYLLKNAEVNLHNLFIGKADFIKITKFAFKNYLGTALQKSNDSLIMLIASSFLSFKEVGYLSLAKKLLQSIVGVSNSVLTVLMPKISKSNLEQITTFIPKVTSILFAFNIIFILIYLYFLEDFIKIIYGNDFIEIVKFSVPLSIVIVFLPFANILLMTITFTGDPIKKMYARGAGLFINLIIFYPLFIFFDAVGFVVSIAIGQFIIFLVSLFFYNNKFKNMKIYNLFILNVNDLRYLIKTIKKQMAI